MLAITKSYQYYFSEKNQIDQTNDKKMSNVNDGVKSCGINEVCIISMSLFGSNHQYTMGAVENAKLVKSVFPGWRLRIYIPKNGMEKNNSGTQKNNLDVPLETIQTLQKYDADIYYVDNTTVTLNPRMWRFLVADDLHTDKFIIRDTDSRLFNRDAVEINQWINSGKIFHCVRDHPLHGNYPVLAGMWGADTRGLKKVLNINFSNLMTRYGQNKFADQQFLKKEIWPKVQNNSYCSDSFFCEKFPHAHPFQMYRSNDLRFIGEIYDANGKRMHHHINMLLNKHENPNCTPKSIKN